MDTYEEQLEKEVPEFKESELHKRGKLDISETVTAVKIHGLKQILGIVAVAVIVIGGWELIVSLKKIPEYVFPKPSAIVTALVTSFPTVYPHFLFTLAELVLGYIVGASIGLVLAAVLTQIPYIEKIITPYILLLITTPTIALVPLLMLRLGFTIWPRIIAVSLAVGPMVMINSVTGFRRTSLAKIALAKSYGATTFQIFTKIRFPLALPMINVGLLVGGIFGLITAVGSDMVGGKIGLGNRIAYYSSLARTANFFAVILLVSIIGISIWVIMANVGKKWASWSE